MDRCQTLVGARPSGDASGDRDTRITPLEPGVESLLRLRTAPDLTRRHSAGPASIAAIATFAVDDKPHEPARPRSASARGGRVLLASPDRHFLTQAVAKLRGTPFRAGIALVAEGVASEIERFKPHVVIIAEEFLSEAQTLVQMLPRRYPGLPILVVASDIHSSQARNWEVVSWGGVGRVPKEELLRGRVLPEVVFELVRIRSTGGAVTP